MSSRDNLYPKCYEIPTRRGRCRHTLASMIARRAPKLRLTRTGLAPRQQWTKLYSERGQDPKAGKYGPRLSILMINTEATLSGSAARS